MKTQLLFLALAAPLMAAGADPLALPAAPLAPFAKLPPLKGAPPAPAMAEAAAKLADATNREALLASVGVTLTKAEEAYLETNRFLVVPKARTRFAGQVAIGPEGFQFDEMAGMYDQLAGGTDPMQRKPEHVRLVTPDIALHVFHKLAENALEQVEKTELGAALRAFVTGLRGRLVASGKEVGGEAGARLTALAARFAVPEAILESANWNPKNPAMEGPDKPVEADDKDTLQAAQDQLLKLAAGIPADEVKKANAELELIFAADKTAMSPFFSGYAKEPRESDYTQFKPRSHYAKVSALRAYFRAMMYLGRNTFLFETDQGITDALLVAWAMAGQSPDKKSLLDGWTRIMEVTGFFAGSPDDVSYPSLRDWALKVLGAKTITPADALNPGTVAKLRAGLKDLAAPKILSDIIADPAIATQTKDDLLNRTKGFRVFGQRFTLDGWVLGQLSAGSEKVPTRLPGVPSVAGLAAVLGSAAGKTIATEALAQETPAFDAEQTKAYFAHLEKVGQALAKVPDEDWYASLSSVWLRVLSRLTAEYGKGYPLYMQSADFGLRQLAAFAGSYAELKHDTLLYAKPQYAEMGDGGDEGTPPAVPRGLVEPNLAFWRELERLSTYFKDGLIDHDILPGEKEEFSNTRRFAELVSFYTKVAEQQLAGGKPSDEDLERLRTATLSDYTKPWGDVLYDEEQMRSGLIADVHTDADSGRILYEATAEPQLMFVLLSSDGPTRLAVGVVYNPYEFTAPTGTRLSDQDWQKKVYTDKPELPANRLRGPGPK